MLTKEQAVPERVENNIIPAHYNSTSITPFQVIDDWQLDFYLGNVIKYICRRKKKNGELEDLKKAATYLAEYIKRLENDKA